MSFNAQPKLFMEELDCPGKMSNDNSNKNNDGRDATKPPQAYLSNLK